MRRAGCIDTHRRLVDRLILFSEVRALLLSLRLDSILRRRLPRRVGLLLRHGHAPHGVVHGVRLVVQVLHAPQRHP